MKNFKIFYLRYYLELESLAQYIMVDSESVYISSYSRDKNGWFFNILKSVQEKINIHDCEIDLKDIYRDVKLEDI